MKKFILSILFFMATWFAYAQTPMFIGKTEKAGDTIEIRLRSIVPTTVEIDFGSGSTVFVDVDSAITVVQGAIGESKEVKMFGRSDQLWVFSVFSYEPLFTEVDVSAMTSLTTLNLANQALTAIDLSKNVKLRELSLMRNSKISDVDVSMLPDLYMLSLSLSGISSIDLSQNPKLRILYISQTDLSHLDLTHNPELWILGCSKCGLTELDLSKNPELTEVVCYGNRLTKLDISHAKDLRYLDCIDNYLVIGELPLFHPIVTTSYRYAPQQPIPMPDTCGYVDFSAGYDQEGFLTEYVWRTDEGKTLIKGIDYEIRNGITNFLKAGLRVSCQMSNDFFPLLTGNNAMKTDFFVTRISTVANEKEESSASKFASKVYTVGRTLCVEAEDVCNVEIFNVSGVLLYAGKLFGRTEYKANTSGLYIVKLTGRGTNIHKAVIR